MPRPSKYTAATSSQRGIWFLSKAAERGALKAKAWVRMAYDNRRNAAGDLIRHCTGWYDNLSEGMTSTEEAGAYQLYYQTADTARDSGGHLQTAPPIHLSKKPTTAGCL